LIKDHSPVEILQTEQELRKREYYATVNTNRFSVGTMIRRQTTIAPGARIVVRDAEWLVRKVQKTSTGDHALTVIGISELVKDKEAMFLDSIDTDIEVLNPEDTRLVPDESSAYRRSMLYMESLLRQTPPTDDNLYIGHRAAWIRCLISLIRPSRHCSSPGSAF
jgi:hypothetical protein